MSLAPKKINLVGDEKKIILNNLTNQTLGTI